MHSMYGLAWTRSMTGLADWRVGGDATRGQPAPKKEAGSEPDRPLMEDSYYSLFALLVFGAPCRGQGTG